MLCSLPNRRCCANKFSRITKIQRRFSSSNVSLLLGIPLSSLSNNCLHFSPNLRRNCLPLPLGFSFYFSPKSYYIFLIFPVLICFAAVFFFVFLLFDLTTIYLCWHDSCSTVGYVQWHRALAHLTANLLFNVCFCF